MLEAEGVTVEREALLPYAFYIKGYDYLAGLESFREGYFYIQDISSMLAVEQAGAKKGDYIIDVCAAPGGKALHLAELMDGTGHVEARDLTEYKTALIEENIRKSGLDNIEAVIQDAAAADEEAYEKADIVIADLPCSGLGVLGKKADLKYKMTPGQQEELVNLQRKILSVVNRYVKPGGRLVYSTCTIHTAENEGNAAWFEDEYQEFHAVYKKQMIPGRDPGDGFYIAVFQRDV